MDGPPCSRRILFFSMLRFVDLHMESPHGVCGPRVGCCRVVKSVPILSSASHTLQDTIVVVHRLSRSILFPMYDLLALGRAPCPSPPPLTISSRRLNLHLLCIACRRCRLWRLFSWRRRGNDLGVRRRLQYPGRCASAVPYSFASKKAEPLSPRISIPVTVT